MKVFKVEAEMRTDSNIEFPIDYYVFVTRSQNERGGYDYTMKHDFDSLAADAVNQSDPCVVSCGENWIEAVSKQFDACIRALNPNVDGLKIVEIVV